MFTDLFFFTFLQGQNRFIFIRETENMIWAYNSSLSSSSSSSFFTERKQDLGGQIESAVQFLNYKPPLNKR